MRRPTVALTFAALLALASPAAAQDAGSFADELRDVDVVFEEEARATGFLTDADLNSLENLADDLNTADASFDVAVLGSGVTEAPSEQAFADEILQELGGDGRVVVLSPAAIGVASDLDDDAEIQRAVAEAEDAATTDQSLTAGVEAAAGALGLEVSAPETGDGGTSDAEGDGGGSGAWIWILLAIVVLGAIGFFWWSSRRRRQAAATADAASVGEGERKVRELVEHASGIIVELADHIDLAGTPPEAQEAFRRGAAAFADLQEELDAADTRPELEAVWPKLVKASWELDVAKALSGGQPAPPEPTPASLFPPAVQPAPLPDPGGRIPVPDLGRGAPAPVPEAHYQQYDQSPFRGGNFGQALSVLIGMGMLNRTLRPPSNRDWFEDQERRGGGFWDGGIGGGSSRSSGGRSRSTRINYGGKSRSVGRRRR
jgi:hypothetical protein